MADPGAHFTDPPLLAVAVLSVGAPSELTAAVRSILDQGVAVELCIVNSGGGDVAARLPGGGQGITIVAVETLLWPGAARNRGILSTSAPFVAFLAADCLAEPGWVAHRLRLHQRGAPAVASAIVNSDPRSAVSTAYHIVHTGTRDPNMAPDRAARYGASYARWMFDRYGLFREDLRVAEDTEFHRRLRHEDRPQWAADVRTVHSNPPRLWPALRQQFERGRNQGVYWADRPGERFARRVRDRVVEAWRLSRVVIPSPRPAGMQAIVALLALANALGRSIGLRTTSAVVRLEAAARADARARRWQRAAGKWADAATRVPDPHGALRSQAMALARAGDDDAALAIHRRLVALHPDDCSVHVGCTTALLAAGRPQDALAFCEQAVARLGRRLPLLEVLAKAHVTLENDAKAGELFAELTATFPANLIGLRGLADMALARRDWNEALLRLQKLGARDDVVALATAIELAEYLGLRPLTDQLLDQLRAADVRGTTIVRQHIDVLSARNASPELVALVEKDRALIVRTPTVLTAAVDALNTCGQSALALDLIAKAESTKRRSFTAQRLATYLNAGRTEEALREFRKHPNVRTLSISSFTALAGAACEASARDAADLVKMAANADNRSALRIAATFESCRLESLAGVTADPPRLASIRCEERVIDVLDAATTRPGKQDDIAQIKSDCRVFSRLRTTRPDFAPDPMVVAADAVVVAAAIASAIRGSQPFTLLRLGDGEGNMLPYRHQYDLFRETDYAATQRVWWGQATASGFDLETQLRAAIDDSDIVGIPDLFRLSQVTTHDALEGTSPRSRNLRGLIAAFDYGAHLPSALITSCHVHQALGYWGLWDLLLPQLNSVSLITCHPQLATALTARFGINVAATYLIPPEHKHAQKFADAPAGRHYPDVFESLHAPLSRVSPGHVVLVAAGVLGKIYCAWIKAAGGIAIDVGSAADHWCGYTTRPAHETLAYQTPHGVRAGMRELAKTDPRVASIVNLRG